MTIFAMSASASELSVRSLLMMTLGSAETQGYSRLIRFNTENFGSVLAPRYSSVLSLRVVEESHLLPGHGDLAEALESHSTSDQVLDVLQAVELFEDCRVAVGVTDEIVGGSEVVRLGGSPMVSS